MRYSEQEIGNEMKGCENKPPVYSGYRYPYHELSDRQFEILLYSIFKKDIGAGVFDGQFDDVSLMTGVGEQGRDCGLYYRGDSVGLIQCKHSTDPATRIDKPSIAREIIKFALYYLQDESLIGEPGNFTYYVAVSSDYSDRAIDLLCDFNQRIVEEEEFQAWVDKVIDRYQAFQGFVFDVIRDDLCEVLRSITVKRINASDLNLKLTEYPDLISHFFSVKMVVSVEEFREEAERNKKRELILQMASSLNPVASEAVRLLRAQGWLQDGTLVGAQLNGANLQKVNLSSADLRDATMRKADLREAELHRADLSGADLRGADLTNAKGLTDEQLAQVDTLSGATMVSGKRYNGRFNLESELIEAHLMKIGQGDQSMARFYGVSVENYKWGQRWNRFSQSPPLMYSPDLEEWYVLNQNPEGPYLPTSEAGAGCRRDAEGSSDMAYYGRTEFVCGTMEHLRATMLRIGRSIWERKEWAPSTGEDLWLSEIHHEGMLSTEGHWSVFIMPQTTDGALVLPPVPDMTYERHAADAWIEAYEQSNGYVRLIFIDGHSRIWAALGCNPIGQAFDEFAELVVKEARGPETMPPREG